MDWELSERKEILEFEALSKRLGLSEKELGSEKDGSVPRMISLFLISCEVILSIVASDLSSIDSVILVVSSQMGLMMSVLDELLMASKVVDWGRSWRFLDVLSSCCEFVRLIVSNESFWIDFVVSVALLCIFFVYCGQEGVYDIGFQLIVVECVVVVVVVL